MDGMMRDELWRHGPFRTKYKSVNKEETLAAPLGDLSTIVVAVHLRVSCVCGVEASGAPRRTVYAST